MFIKGRKSGNINGSVTARGFENSIAVGSVSHEMSSLRDPQSGLPTGRRQRKPLVLVVTLDRSWPVLMQALTTSESLADIQQYTVDATDGTPSRDVLKISLTYQKIEWTWNNGGIRAMDDWSARN